MKSEDETHNYELSCYAIISRKKIAEGGTSESG